MTGEVSDVKAILICGVEKNVATNGDEENDFDFTDDCLRFRRYLRNKVGLPEEKIFFYDAEKVLKLKPNGLIRDIKKIVSENCREPLVIYYSGHGSIGSWSLFKRNGATVNAFDLEHEELTDILKNRRGPLIAIADCCFAMSLFCFLNELKCKKMVLGLSPANRKGYGSGFIGRITRSWLKREPANPKYDIDGDEERYVRYIKARDYRKSSYYIIDLDNGKTRRYYYCYRFKKVAKIILRRGDSLDYLLYPKK